MARIGKLKTADNLIMRGIQVPPHCSLCSGHLENHSHLFFDCDFTFYILKHILPDFNSFLLRPTLPQVLDYIENSLSFDRTDKEFCYLAISCITYHIWKERSSRLFSNLKYNVATIICNISLVVRLKIAKWKHKPTLLQRLTSI
ncbi:hypothetical protein MA16_Dca006211 [Dendrobium catenatum]|uniref:Reverse transcriptase zinc-binding domain-containing protein n=1 Tax=Dendrobium catenatum TaxID=906689 RepID=A0A2I0X4T5_9ASPA|nr:hypothetical protein MA16_Dca006211 [Dendrobium catenatum]